VVNGSGIMDCPDLYACVSAAHNTVLKTIEYHMVFQCDAYESILRDGHRSLFDQCTGSNGDPQLASGRYLPCWAQ
jgi:hypothetical protein